MSARLEQAPLRAQILHALAQRPRGTDDLVLSMSNTARKHIEAALDKLGDEGLIALKYGKWHPTKRGYAAVPRTLPSIEMEPYRPPARPPRRPGSERRDIPSVMGGRLITRG